MLPINVLVDEFTTINPIIATEDLTVNELRQLMKKHGIRHLPVVRNDQVVGIISDRDIRLVEGLTKDEKLQVCAGDFMSTDPLTVRANTPLDKVAYTMSEKKVGSVIVTDENGKFRGIFTATDALNALIEIVREIVNTKDK